VARWRGIAVAACTALAAGAALPWITAAGTAEPVVTVTRVEPLPAGPEIAAAPAAQAGTAAQAALTGVVAIGDDVLLEARTCLEARGIEVHPRPVSTADELIDAVERRMVGKAVLVVYAGSRNGLVDGQIERVMDSVGPGRRVVWSTIRMAGAAWGTFSFEERTNASIRNVVGRASDGRVLDWTAMALSHPEWTVGGASFSEEGCREFARKADKLSGQARRT
jgi:hypothetical protein